MCVFVQIFERVQALLPDVMYNGPARILTLRASGVRKQPRLPGQKTSLYSGRLEIQVGGIARKFVMAGPCEFL